MSEQGNTAGTNPANNAQPGNPVTKKGMFGVTVDTKSSNLIPFIPTEHDPIPMAFLRKVESTIRDVQGDDKNVLIFTFTDKDNKRTHQHTEWMLDRWTDDDDRDKKINALNARIKHIYEAFAEFPSDGIGLEAESWKDFFDAVATAFNTNGKEKTPIFSNVAVWLKIAVSKNAVKKGLQIPYAPNFIEKVITNNGNIVRTSLYINPKYETLKVKMDEVGTGSDNNALFGNTGGGGAPEFPSV